MTSQAGTIAVITYDRGYGFVDGDDGVKYFFHQTGLSRTAFLALKPGERVLFTQEESTRGPRARIVIR